jgi:hypothetical protein
VAKAASLFENRGAAALKRRPPVLITLTARIFSGSHTKESHARMRNKTDNPPPETTQAPPASPDPASPAPPTFHPHERASTLQDEVLRVIALVGGKRELGLAIVNRDLRSGLLEGALVALDGTMTPFSSTDWERRTVHAPHNPAEGVRVEPYEAGYYFVWRAGLAELKPRRRRRRRHLPLRRTSRRKADPASPAPRPARRTAGRPPSPGQVSSSSPPTSPRKNVSEAKLRKCILKIKTERPNRPPDEEELWTDVEQRLKATVSRDRLRQVRDDVAPEWKLPPGRPRKSTQ